MSGMTIHPMPINPSPIYYDQNMMYQQTYQNPGNIIVIHHDGHASFNASPEKGNMNETFVK